MIRLAIVTALTLSLGAAFAQETPAPQAEDREAPPLSGSEQPAPEPAKSEAPEPAQPPPKAEPEAKSADTQAPPPAAAPAAHPVRMTAHAYEEESTGALADTVEAAIAAELAGDSRIRFIPKHDILDPPDQAPRALGEADLQSVDADDALAQGDTDKAKTLLQKALVTYQKYLPELAARGGGLDPFRDAWIKLAKARFFDGDQKGARDAMRYVFVLDPSVKWDPKLFPPAMKKVVVESSLLFDTLGPGTLTIDSDPPGATVYLNGKKLDKATPLEGVAAPPGPNYISYVRHDWQPATAIFEVAGGGEQASAVRSLEHYAGRPLQPLLRARQELETSPSPPTLKEGAAKLGVDILLLVRLNKAAEGSTRLVAYLYDARPNRVLKRAEKTAPDGELDSAARALARDVLAGVRLDGILVAPKPPKGPGVGERLAAKMKQFRHWKGFWYVVGGVAGAAVVGAAVGIGVSAGHAGPSPGEQIVLIGGR